VYLPVGGLLLLISIFPSLDQFKRWTGFAAFRVPSSSMCPTICENERIVADTNGYKNNGPQRGDLVMVKHPLFGPLLIKRVVGIPGDIIEPGPQDIIMINGAPLASPEICKENLGKNDSDGNGPTFHATKIPEGALFVIGDNLGNSLDSRFPMFGLVQFEEVRGKPLFLDWSPTFCESAVQLAKRHFQRVLGLAIQRALLRCLKRIPKRLNKKIDADVEEGC
jgi:signal peptidase I